MKPRLFSAQNPNKFWEQRLFYGISASYFKYKGFCTVQPAGVHYFAAVFLFGWQVYVSDHAWSISLASFGGVSSCKGCDCGCASPPLVWQWDRTGLSTRRLFLSFVNWCGKKASCHSWMQNCFSVGVVLVQRGQKLPGLYHGFTLHTVEDFMRVCST